MMEFKGASLKGKEVIHKKTTIAGLQGVFKNENARKQMAQDTGVYSVQLYLPVDEGTLGGLFFGITKIQPGLIGNEYYMTRGHFHAVSNRGEYYWGIEGEGKLILMDRSRNVWAEDMYAGSLHYIPSHTAHRVANTGDDILSFGACWPSDAGHDYEEIAKNGFASRLLKINGIPELTADQE